jgi:uncharacterized membrane protein HdeD (DUF308 family)
VFGGQLDSGEFDINGTSSHISRYLEWLLGPNGGINNGAGNILSKITQGFPGQKQTTWWIALLEGILLLGIGIFTLANPQAVAPWIVVLIGVYLLIDSGLIIQTNTKGQAHSASRSYQLAAGGIGLITGLFLLLQLLLGNDSLQITRTIFSIGLLLSGLVFLYGIVATDDKHEVKGSDIAANTLKVMVAVLFLITPPGANLQLIAIFAAVFGVILVVNAIILLRRSVKNQH